MSSLRSILNDVEQSSVDPRYDPYENMSQRDIDRLLSHIANTSPRVLTQEFTEIIPQFALLVEKAGDMGVEPLTNSRFPLNPGIQEIVSRIMRKIQRIPAYFRNPHDSGQFNPFFLASTGVNPEIMRIMIDSDYPVNFMVENQDRDVPLSLLSIDYSIDMLRYLISKRKLEPMYVIDAVLTLAESEALLRSLNSSPVNNHKKIELLLSDLSLDNLLNIVENGYDSGIVPRRQLLVSCGPLGDITANSYMDALNVLMPFIMGELLKRLEIANSLRHVARRKQIPGGGGTGPEDVIGEFLGVRRQLSFRRSGKRRSRKRKK